MLKLNNEAVVFGWYEGGGWALSSKPVTPTKGPLYNTVGSMMIPVEPVDRSYCHYLDDLLKMSFSESTKRRLKAARPGTMIKVHQLGKTSSIWLQRLTAEEIDDYNRCNHMTEELKVVNAEIAERVGDLETRKHDLQSKIKKFGYL